MVLSVTGASNADILLLVTPLSFEEYVEQYNKSLLIQTEMQFQGLGRASELKSKFTWIIDMKG